MSTSEQGRPRIYLDRPGATDAAIADAIAGAVSAAQDDGTVTELAMREGVMALIVPGPGKAEPDIREDDLDVSTVRPGGHAADVPCLTTGEFDAYVRITHRPTGITVERDAERSQLLNKHAALEEIRRQLRERTL